MLLVGFPYIKRGRTMAKAHMTKAYWYDTELDKLLDIGYDGQSAHQMIMDRLAKMDAIEWYEPTNNLTVLSEQEAL
jgi:hypothetical protein